MRGTTVAPSSKLRRRQSVFDVPGIGWRTARVLYEAGIRTVGQFVGLPQLLLRETFGPSLVAIQQRAQAQYRHPVIVRSLFHLLAL